MSIDYDSYGSIRWNLQMNLIDLEPGQTGDTRS